MIRDITIGQYYPAQSPIHKLDPRVKIVCTLIFLVSLFVQNSVLGYALAFVFLACMIHVSKVPAKFIGKGLKPIVILLLFTVAMNLFLTRGGAVLFHWGIITITETGLRTSVFMAVRLVLLVAGSSLMTFTTTPNGLTDGLEKLLHPLNRIHVPVHEVSMMMSIALRFIPILLEETDKIMKAQIARGADFESGNIIQRAKAMIPILVPLSDILLLLSSSQDPGQKKHDTYLFFSSDPETCYLRSCIHMFSLYHNVLDASLLPLHPKPQPRYLPEAVDSMHKQTGLPGL